MKVITKNVIIKEQNHVLIQIDESDFKEEIEKDLIGKYGTIPYEWLDESGRLNRKITFLNMLLSDTISRAIDHRRDLIICKNMSEQELINYFIHKLN